MAQTLADEQLKLAMNIASIIRGVGVGGIACLVAVLAATAGVAAETSAKPVPPAESATASSGTKGGEILLVLDGRWAGASADGTEVSYSFTRRGTVTWRVAAPSFQQAYPDGLQAKYRVQVAQPHWEIDVYDFVDPTFGGVVFRGIIEIVDGHSFKMQGRPSNQGDRPKDFTDAAIVFRTGARE